MQDDGGDIEFVKFEEDTGVVFLQLQGLVCCPPPRSPSRANREHADALHPRGQGGREFHPEDDSRMPLSF